MWVNCLPFPQRKLLVFKFESIGDFSLSLSLTLCFLSDNPDSPRHHWILFLSFFGFVYVCVRGRERSGGGLRMNLTSEVVLPLPLDSHSPLQIHVKTNRPFKASAGFEVIESLSLSLSFPSPFSHSTKLTAMHCLQASLMSADFFPVILVILDNVCCCSQICAHYLLAAFHGSPILPQCKKEEEKKKRNLHLQLLHFAIYVFIHYFIYI